MFQITEHRSYIQEGELLVQKQVAPLPFDLINEELRPLLRRSFPILDARARHLFSAAPMPAFSGASSKTFIALRTCYIKHAVISRCTCPNTDSNRAARSGLHGISPNPRRAGPLLFTSHQPSSAGLVPPHEMDANLLIGAPLGL